MEVLYIIKSSSADICSGTPCNKASNEDLCRYDAPVQCTMQQGLTFEKKVITKCSTLKIDFSANFHLTHDILLAEALSTPQKLENAKRNLQISI